MTLPTYLQLVQSLGPEAALQLNQANSESPISRILIELLLDPIPHQFSLFYIRDDNSTLGRIGPHHFTAAPVDSTATDASFFSEFHPSISQSIIEHLDFIHPPAADLRIFLMRDNWHATGDWI